MFKEMCEDGLWGQGDNRLFEDWLARDRLRDAYIRIRNRLVLEGEVQKIEDKENFYNEGPYQACVCGFFLAYHQVVAYRWWLLFCPTDLEHYCEFEVSLERVMFIAHILIIFFSFGTCIRQV